MVRIRSLVEIIDVTRSAVGRCAGILAAHVARRTCNRRVRAGQREYSLTVVEIRRRPRNRRVARLASRRETTLDMVRTGRLVEVVDMA